MLETEKTQKFTKGLVSIIINTYNNIDLIGESIDSALAQTYSPIEVLVYDNASTEDIEGLVKGYGGRVRYFRSEEPLALGRARNEAFNLSRGEFIDYLDSDDLFEKEKIEKQMPHFADPEVGLVISNGHEFGQKKGQDYRRNIYEGAFPSGHVFGQLLRSNFIHFVTAIGRREAMQQASPRPFTEHFCSCLDYDLFLRICFKYKLAAVDEPLAHYRVHENNWTHVHKDIISIEKFHLLKNILSYEPNVFKKFRSEANSFLATIYEQRSTYFWIQGIYGEAFLSALHSVMLCFRMTNFIKMGLTLFHIPHRWLFKNSA